MQSHKIRGSGGVKLRVDETGESDGTSILFLHGYSQCRLAWRKQFQSHLSTDSRLIAMDLRGHGSSDKPRDVYDNASYWADDVQAVIEALDLSDFYLVAWSYAGLVALAYLDAYGTDRVAGLNMVGAISGIGTEAATELLGEPYLDLFPELTSTDAEESVAALETFVRRCVYEELSAADRYFMLGYNTVVPPHVRDALRMRTVSHRDVLTELDIPVLLTHGTEDDIILPTTAAVHADLVSNPHVSRYPAVGHTPFWEAPDRFNRELQEFITDR